VMSILQVLMKRPGGTHRQPPVEETTTFVGKVLSMSSSALQTQVTTHQARINLVISNTRTNYKSTMMSITPYTRRVKKVALGFLPIYQKQPEILI